MITQKRYDMEGPFKAKGKPPTTYLHKSCGSNNNIKHKKLKMPKKIEEKEKKKR
ncbi:hypothetical protein QJS04_geneDACA014709 [Acorus gramineus]|uniref:Uncharacterized protein n=1 Tax=Acorus gramineus TaxID=55184 RepID=A0AAV9B5R6_ACOGR|nr:hypothetical protein QJS04_geneDACA014709 [Acorus gramineus]